LILADGVLTLSSATSEFLIFGRTSDTFLQPNLSDEVVNEPSTWLLLAAGLTMLVRRRNVFSNAT
jgi:hypothetical protein